MTLKNFMILFFLTGALNPAGTATLRRTPSHAGTLLRGPPPPVMRRTSSVSGSPTEGAEGYDSYQGHEPPPPPAPAPHVARPGGQGSNSTTPRGSMENLPPPVSQYHSPHPHIYRKKIEKCLKICLLALQ